MSEPKVVSSKKFFVSIICVALLCSVFSAVLVQSFGNVSVEGKSHFFDVQISPSSAKLGVNETVSLVCEASGGVEPYSYFWSVANATGPYLDCFVFESLGNQANFTFTSATEDVYRVSVKVVDGIGATMQTDALLTDPYTHPNSYANIAYPYSYLIEPDGLGWYRAINKNGVVSWESTNSSYVLQQAITNGDSTHITSGTYPITHRLTVDDGDKIVGDGNTTILALADGADCDTFFGNGVSDVILRDMFLDGNMAGNTAGHGVNCYGLTSNNWLIENIVFKEHYEMSILIVGSNHRVLNNYMYDDSHSAVSGRDGVFAEIFTSEICGNQIIKRGDTGIVINQSPASHSTIANNIISEVEAGMYVVRNSSDLTITGNIFDDPVQGGLYIEKYETAFIVPRDLVISDNIFDACSPAIRCADTPQFLTITNNEFHNNYIDINIASNGLYRSIISGNFAHSTQRQFFIEGGGGTKYNSITNNVGISGSQESSNTYNYIQIGNYGEENFISGNKADGGWKYGIYMSGASSTNNVATNNDFVGCETDGISFANTPFSVTSGNIGYTELGDVQMSGAYLQIYNGTAWETVN